MDSEILRKKILAGWLGKAIGGTLGGPFEGVMDVLSLDFYDPVPAEAMPNDDLDLQLVWIHHLRTQRYREVTPETLAQAWIKHVQFPFDEYGVGIRNYRRGMPAADCGWYDNYFGECMGAAIRSELWAALAPGDPERAAGFAWADAVFDHSGDGVWAEVFLAALQSLAFVESDPDVLLDRSLTFLPAESRVRRAVQIAREGCQAGRDWLAVRKDILDAVGMSNFTDVACNLGFTVLGWLAGKGDFGKSLCIATNCGYDTDCTAATLGALLGIIDPDSIPQKWIDPIGDKVVVSDPIVGIVQPRTLDELTEWTIELADQLKDARPVVGPVRPCKPVEAAQAIRSYTVAVDPVLNGAFTEDTVPALADHSEERYGTWLRPGETHPEGCVVRINFPAAPAKTLKLLAYYRFGVRAWLNGEEVLRTEPNAKHFDGFEAPTFHRGGASAKNVPLSTSGENELVLALGPVLPGAHSEETDLVFGFGYPESNMWVPEFFPLHQPVVEKV